MHRTEPKEAPPGPSSVEAEQEQKGLRREAGLRGPPLKGAKRRQKKEVHEPKSSSRTKRGEKNPSKEAKRRSSAKPI